MENLYFRIYTKLHGHISALKQVKNAVDNQNWKNNEQNVY